jgi:proteasome lid subunit RPN8/RPN11
MQNLFDLYEDSFEEERCGFILKDGDLIELRNSHPEPTIGFEIDPKDTLAYIDQLAAIWHTHPQEPSVLSGEDKSCMEQWPDLKHYIVGEDGVRVYVVKDGVVLNEDYFPR